MRYLLELDGDGDGPVTGTVALPGGQPVGFSGWLELLRLLGGGLARPAPPAPREGSDRSEEHA